MTSPKICGTDLLLRAPTEDDYGWFYQMLAERDPAANISHGEMPGWEKHCEYIAQICQDWEVRIILLDHRGLQKVGYYYITDRGEVGIQIARLWQGNGFGPQVIAHLIKEKGGRRLLANVSPYNGRSQKMFQRLGFKPLQITYSIDCAPLPSKAARMRPLSVPSTDP